MATSHQRMNEPKNYDNTHNLKLKVNSEKPQKQNHQKLTQKKNPYYHSATLDTCIAQVGKDKALAGSLSCNGNSAADTGSNRVRAKPAPMRPPIAFPRPLIKAFLIGFRVRVELANSRVLLWLCVEIGFGGCKSNVVVIAIFGRQAREWKTALLMNEWYAGNSVILGIRIFIILLLSEAIMLHQEITIFF